MYGNTTLARVTVLWVAYILFNQNVSRWISFLKPEICPGGEPLWVAMGEAENLLCF